MAEQRRLKKLQEVMHSEFLMLKPKHIRYDQLTKEEKEMFKADARVILNAELFPWIMEEMKRAARQIMDEKAQNFDDVLGGKFMFYTLDVLEQKLRNIAK